MSSSTQWFESIGIMSISRAAKTQALRKCYVHAKGQGTFGSSLLDLSDAALIKPTPAVAAVVTVSVFSSGVVSCSRRRCGILYYSYLVRKLQIKFCIPLGFVTQLWIFAK
jgi:hypothetical protein